MKGKQCSFFNCSLTSCMLQDSAHGYHYQPCGICAARNRHSESTREGLTTSRTPTQSMTLSKKWHKVSPSHSDILEQSKAQVRWGTWIERAWAWTCLWLICIEGNFHRSITLVKSPEKESRWRGKKIEPLKEVQKYSHTVSSQLIWSNFCLYSMLGRCWLGAHNRMPQSNRTIKQLVKRRTLCYGCNPLNKALHK